MNPKLADLLKRAVQTFAPLIKTKPKQGLPKKEVPLKIGFGVACSCRRVCVVFIVVASPPPRISLFVVALKEGAAMRRFRFCGTYMFKLLRFFFDSVGSVFRLNSLQSLGASQYALRPRGLLGARC